MISDEVRKQVLSLIKPNEKEKSSLQTQADELLSLLQETATSLNISSSFFIGGSFGKGTYLRDSFDVDIFCRFDLTYDDSSLSSLAKKILEETSLNFQIEKGSRDYYSGSYKSLKFEIVPNYYIETISDAKNSTDYSPYHVEFVKHAAKKNPNLLDEIRLTKQFFKAQNLYGAESYINGFSGHSIDLLLIYYGSFENFLSSVKQSWQEVTCIDVAGFYENQKELLLGIDSSKYANLILVDSILKDRNAAKALSEDMYFKLLHLVSNKDKFSYDDFLIVKKTSSQHKEESRSFAQRYCLTQIQYELYLEDFGSEDIAGSKLLKLLSKVKSYYASYDFTCFSSDFSIFFDEGICIYTLYFSENSLPLVKEIQGPHVFRKDAMLAFERAKGPCFVRGNRVYSYIVREITQLEKIEPLTLESFKSLSSRSLDFVISLVHYFYNK